MGDALENPTFWNMFGQIAIGFTPIGWAGDARDIGMALWKLAKGEGNGLEALIALAAVVPGLDALKGGAKLLDHADEAADAMKVMGDALKGMPPGFTDLLKNPELMEQFTKNPELFQQAMRNGEDGLAKGADNLDDLAKGADNLGDLAKGADEAGSLAKGADNAGDLTKGADDAGDLTKGVDTPPTHTPDVDAPHTRAPEPDAPHTRAPDADAPHTRAPEPDAPHTRAPEPDAPETHAGKGDAEPHPQEQSVLDSTASKPGDRLNPSELSTEKGIVDRTPARDISDGPYTKEVDLGNGHQWRERQDGAWCRFSEDPRCFLRDPSGNLQLIDDATKNANLSKLYDNPKMAAYLAEDPNLALRLAEDPRLAALIAENPEVMNVIAARESVLQSFLKSPQATDFLEQALLDVKREGVDGMLALKRTPLPTPLTDEEKALSDLIKSSMGDKPLQPGFDISLIGDRAAIEDYLRALCQQAEEAKPELKQLTDQIAELSQGTPKFRPGAKDWNRSLDKIITDYKGDAALLTDLAGSKVVYDRIGDLYAGLRQVREMLGDSLLAFKDRLMKPQASGYRDILMNIGMDNGHIAEFRLHLSRIDKYADAEHALYELTRSFGPVAEEMGRGNVLTAAEDALKIALDRLTQPVFEDAIFKSR